MIVNFLRVAADSTDERAAYIARAMRTSPACADAAPHWASGLDDVVPPLLVDPGQWPPLSAAQQAVVADRIACARRRVDAVLQLDDDETVENDVVSYLAEEWGVLPAGTPVVRRTTSRGVVDCLFDDVAITPDGPDVVRAVRSPVPLVAGDDGVGGHVLLGIEGIALDLAKALLEKLASYAIETIMGSSVPDYFGEVYREIRTIVAEELDVHMIRELTDEFVGKQEWNNRHYLPLKESGASAATLNDEMAAKQDVFYSYLAKLKDAKVAHVALGEFLIGASMHLAFLQELVTLGVRPSWAVELAKNAIADAAHVEATWPTVATDRAALITAEADKECVPVNGYTKCSFFWSTYDKETATWGSRHWYPVGDKDREKAAKTAAEADRDRWRADAVVALSTRLGEPMQTAATWRRLA